MVLYPTREECESSRASEQKISLDAAEVQPGVAGRPIIEGADDCTLIAIVGPTASGKSELALMLAQRLNGEVVNYDSVQLYRGFDIGSGKLSVAERRGITHHLLDVLEPGDNFTAGDYHREARKVLADLRARGKYPILAGGTGLYLRALLQGLFEGPTRSETLRERLRRVADRRGREFLHRMLTRLDRAAAARIQPRDTQKVIRAVEVCVLAKQPISAMQAAGRVGLDGYHTLKLGLDPPRAQLYDRINQRVERMFADGLIDETRALIERPDSARIKPLEALGYRQARTFLDGRISKEEAVAAAQLATRHYAKRQLTWFRRETDVNWFEGFGDDPKVQSSIMEALTRMPVRSRAGMLASQAVSVL